MDRQAPQDSAIAAVLPHRGPALLVDAVVDRGPGHATLERQVAPDDPLLAPLAFGGLLLAEAMAQACALAHAIGGPGRPALLAGLRLTVQGHPRPGDRLLLTARLLRHRAGWARFATEAHGPRGLLARAEITLAAG